MRSDVLGGRIEMPPVTAGKPSRRALDRKRTAAARESLSSPDAGLRARRQLRRVLVLLGGLDLSVLVLVVGLALAASSLGLTRAELLLSILLGVGVILGVGFGSPFD